MESLVNGSEGGRKEERGGFRGQSEEGRGGGRSRRGRGGRSSQTGGSDWELTFRPIRSGTKVYADYPGWPGNILHGIVSGVDFAAFNKEETDWEKIASRTGHTPEECRNIWEKLQKDAKPVTFKSAIDSAKVLLLKEMNGRYPKEMEGAPEWPGPPFSIFMEENRQKGVPESKLWERFTSFPNIMRARYLNKLKKRQKQCLLTYFEYYKENLEEFDKLCRLKL